MTATDIADLLRASFRAYGTTLSQGVEVHRDTVALALITEHMAKVLWGNTSEIRADALHQVAIIMRDHADVALPPSIVAIGGLAQAANAETTG